MAYVPDKSSAPVISPQTDILHINKPGHDVKWRVKRYHINYESASQRVKTKKMYNILTSVLVVLIAFSLYSIYNIQCCDKIDSVHIAESLNNKIYGQGVALKTIEKALLSEEKMKLLIFYGSTGVGKTYASSLILQEIWNFTNIYHYTLQSFKDTYDNSLFLGQYLCNSMVIVIDDINEINLDVLKQVNEIVMKSEHLGKAVTIILIYSCSPVDSTFKNKCDDTFLNTIQNNLKSIKAYKEFVKFQSLNEEDLRKCILEFLDNKEINESEYRNLARNFNVKLDGCKGVGSKMKFLIQKN